MWELYETKLNAYGETTRERQLEQAREDFYREAVKNPAYHKALRNGVEQDFLIQRTDKTERFKITAFPGDDLNIGDYVEVWGETFLVYQTRVQNTLNKTGILWLCNHKFRWIKFYVDDSDNTITAEADAITTPDEAGEEIFSVLARLVGIIDRAHPEMMKTLWS